MNHDGYDDLIIAAQSDRNMGTAKIYIMFGQNISGDIALRTSADVILERDYVCIGAMAVGDLNGDGIDDLAISDILTNSGANPPVQSGHSPSGGVYILFGKTGGWTSPVNLQTQSNVTFVRNNGASVLQIASLAIGDINNDGKADLVMAAPEESNPTYSLSNAGRVYAVFGGSAFPASGNKEIDTEADVTIYGAEKDDKIGGSLEVTHYNDKSLAVGDVDGDGIGDILIGAPLSMVGKTNSTGIGKVEILYGRSNWGSVPIDLYNDYDIRLKLSATAQKIGINTGYAVAVEDVNGDGQGDIAVSSPHAPTPNYNGYMHVIYGGSGLKKDYQIDLESDLLITTASPPDWYGNRRMGESFVIGNFNNTGKPDIILGAPKGAGFSGETSAG
ncbi:MAG: FG-GAP and VCBS repeat-containing protein, partial [Desulfobacterales bacterium]